SNQFGHALPIAHCPLRRFSEEALSTPATSALHQILRPTVRCIVVHGATPASSDIRFAVRPDVHAPENHEIHQAWDRLESIDPTRYETFWSVWKSRLLQWTVESVPGAWEAIERLINARASRDLDHAKRAAQVINYLAARGVRQARGLRHSIRLR